MIDWYDCRLPCNICMEAYYLYIILIYIGWPVANAYIQTELIMMLWQNIGQIYLNYMADRIYLDSDRENFSNYQIILHKKLMLYLQKIYWLTSLFIMLWIVSDLIFNLSQMSIHVRFVKNLANAYLAKSYYRYNVIVGSLPRKKLF